VTAAEATWLLLGARVAPSGLVFSLASRGALPSWLGLGCALALAAGLGAGLPPVSLSLAPFAVSAAILRELCLGFSFAFAALLPFFALSGGIGLVEREPSVERAPFRALYLLAGAALTLSLGGLRAYARALSESLRVLPLATANLSRVALLAQTQLIVAQAIGVAIALALPLLTALWLLDLCLALVQRVAHGESKTEVLPVRRALSLGLLVLLCAPLASRLPELTRAALNAANELLLRLAR
jgi:type III secretory pathway component EscT